MASITLFDNFLLLLGAGYYYLHSDTLVFALTNLAPTKATDQGFLPFGAHRFPTNMNGYSQYGIPATGVSWTTNTGVATLACSNNIVITATGALGPFQYILLYDDTTSSPIVDCLIGYWDYGSSISMINGETFTIEMGASLFTLT